jgi:hypothetical protein
VPLYVPDVTDTESSNSRKTSDTENSQDVSSVKDIAEDVKVPESSISPPSLLESVNSKDLSKTSENELQSLVCKTDIESNNVPKFQTSDSTDSLLSGQQSASVSPETRERVMPRSLSTDSGKGSLFDESGVIDGNSSQNSDEFLDGNLGMDVIEGILGAEAHSDVTETKSNGEIRKSLSSSNLVQGDKPRLSLSRSQSVYNAATKRQPNITPNLQISTETHNLLFRAGYLSKKGMKKTSDEDFQVMGPPPPRIKQVEFHKPKRESILELKMKHAGRVAASIKQFEAGSIPPVAEKAVNADIIERHNSPLRFPNCVSRKAGASPLKIPAMITRKESIVNKKNDCHPNKLLSKGQARLPISTQLLKPTEQVAVTNVDSKVTEKSKKPTRQPSIYYATDSDASNLDFSKAQETAGDDSVFDGTGTSPLPEPMETSDTNPQNKENVSSTEPIKNGESNNSVSDTFTGTQSKQEPIVEKSKDSKLPKLLQPLGDSVVLRTPAGLTPKRVLQRSNTTCSPRSPIKAVKRLGSSPGSPGCRISRRNSMSPRRPHNKISLPTSVPQYLQDEMNGM